MDLPLPPVERLRTFRPSFCPRRKCPDHRTSRSDYRVHVHGSYTTARGKVIPRYLCLTCKKTFSRQAFSSAYSLKRAELLFAVAAGLVAGSAHRQIARVLGCAPSTVTRLAYRIGRACLLLGEEAASELDSQPDREPIVLDHFETFEFSQDLPFGVATAIGQDSWFVRALDPAPHRRTGPLPPAIRKRLKRRNPRPTKGGYLGSTRRILDRLLGSKPAGATTELRIVCDGHASYQRAIARHPARRRIRHEIHPNPERGPKGSPRSDVAIARDRALFAADLLHGLIRHSQAAHRRETIAFGRRLNALMLRLWVLAVWRNFIKGRSERKPDPTTPAMAVWLTDRPWRWSDALSRRRFPDRVGLRGVSRELYDLAWTTPELPSNARHQLRLAY